MKKILVALSIALSATAIQAQTNTTIEADLKGLEAGQWVYCSPLVDRDKVDSVQTRADGFTLPLDIPKGEGDAYLIRVGKKYGNYNLTLIYIDKGTVYVKGEGPFFKDAKFSGGKEIADQDDYNLFIKENPALQGRDSLFKRYNDLYAKKDSAGYGALEPEVKRMDSTTNALTRQWVLAHPSSPASAFILSFHLGRLDLDEKEAIYNKLSSSAKNNAPAKRIAHSIKVNALTGIGKTAMNFTQNDTAGKPVSLKDFRGKYVLVDFWASWCVPCRGENPNVVKAYKAYHDKNFTVLGVSLDQPNGKEKWLKAIHDDGLTWTQVSDLKWWNNAVAKQFDIQSIPANLLISPEGKILAKDLHGPALQHKLSELLGPPAASPFTLKGKVTDLDKGFAYLGWQEGKNVPDSVALDNGSFQFSGTISHPVMAAFYVKASPGSRLDMKHYTGLFLEPASMELKVAYDDIPAAQLTGSVSELEHAAYQRQVNRLEKRWTVVMDTLTAANKRSNFEYQALKDWVLIPYFQEYNEIGMDFISTHPSSWFAAYLVAGPLQRDLSDDTLKMFYTAFPEQVQQSNYGKAILTELENRKKGVPGAVAASFSATDIDGKPIALEDYKGKYVLLDFWASWCLPCRKEGPHLKELYSLYKDKGLEIIGVAGDDRTPDAWKKAVAQDGLPWKHILSGLKWTKEGGYDHAQDILEKYNVSELPTQILIGPDGKVIGRFKEESFGRGELDKQLAGVFPNSAGAAAHFTIDGSISGYKGRNIWLTRYANRKAIRDSTIIVDGKFHFSGETNGVDNAILHIDPVADRQKPERSGSFLLEAAPVTITIKEGDLQHAKVEGSAAEDDQALLNAQIAPIREEEKGLDEEYEASNKRYIEAVKAHAPDKELDFMKEQAAALHNKFEPYNLRIQAVMINFVSTHPNSYVSVMQLRYLVQSLPLDSIKGLFAALSPRLKQSRNGQEVQHEIDKLIAGSPGSPAKDFTTMDLDGKPLTLSSFKGKDYVIIDFWASWCVPCRHSNPHMKDLYQKYHDKGLEVIGVSDDDGKPDAWKKAIAQDGVGIWHNVLRGLDWDKINKGEPNEKDINEKFGIHSLPTKILVDKNGTIIGRYGEGRDDEAAMDRKLEEIFL